MKKELTLEEVIRSHKALQQILIKKNITVFELAKEVGTKATAMIEFLNKHSGLVEFVNIQDKSKKVLGVREIFLELKDRRGTEEWLTDQIAKKERVLALSHYNNYGYINGQYIEPSKDLEAKYLNTPEKLQFIKEKYNPPSAGYHIGGFGDSSYIKPEGGLELSKALRDQLKLDGWIFLNEAEIKDEK